VGQGRLGRHLVGASVCAACSTHSRSLIGCAGASNTSLTGGYGPSRFSSSYSSPYNSSYSSPYGGSTYGSGMYGSAYGASSPYSTYGGGYNSGGFLNPYSRDPKYCFLHVVLCA
jgi:hypothetical protein